MGNVVTKTLAQKDCNIEMYVLDLANLNKAKDEASN